MLWAALRFSHLPTELRVPREKTPLAICDRSGQRRIVIDANCAATANGIDVGMQATAALLREPELTIVDRTESNERRALKALADWALQFSSLVCSDADRWLIWIEVGASLRYFDGLEAIRKRLEQGIALLDYTAYIGVASTLEAAALLTWCSDTPVINNRDEILKTLAPLSSGLLPFDDRVTEQLRTTGLITIGDVLAIPAPALARRFGTHVTDYLRRLLGQHPDPRRRHVAPQRYRRRYDFADPIASLEGLLFPLRRMLSELEGYLRGRDAAIQSVEVTMRHRDSPEASFTLHTSAPIRDALRLFALLREKLERTPWASPVTEIVIYAREFHAPEIVQRDFFDDSQRRTAGWTTLLDKLRARLGEEAVRRLGLRDDHRPEHAWCVKSGESDCKSHEPLPDRPLWLLKPTPVDRPARLLGQPERIEAGWWSGTEVARDYYIAISAEGARWWLYREASSGEWLLHGLWA